MHTKHFISLSLIASFVLFVGCGPQLPDGMPRLYPVTITVTQEGQPFPEALVSLRSVDTAATGTWTIGGRTGADGTVELYTSGFRGAPVGTFRVVLFREDNVGLAEREAAALRGDPFEGIVVRIWSLVQEEYNHPDRTPIEIEITPDTRTLTIDAGPAVRIERPFVP